MVKSNIRASCGAGIFKAAATTLRGGYSAQNYV